MLMGGKTALNESINNDVRLRSVAALLAGEPTKTVVAGWRR